MKRLIESELIAWKQNVKRKPLLINGIRQVGKTWSVKQFGKEHFESFLYVNFDLEPSLSKVFQNSKDPKKILMELSLFYDRTIEPTTTLIFFDEIQSCNEALNALKYFEESNEAYYVIAAGSYLGVTLSKGDSFPVGKVELIEMKPMTFKEFLLAKDMAVMVDHIEAINHMDGLSELIFEKLQGVFREFYMIGGMPEVVQEWVISNDLEKANKVQENILNAYYRDFSKYPPMVMIPRILGVWNAIVGQLSKENKKFKYSEINKGARAREYENALDWLLAGNYLKRVEYLEKLEMPIKGYLDEKHFKLYMPDVGLLRCKADFPMSELSTLKDQEIVPFKGALAENVVLQELDFLHRQGVYFWAGQNYEVDFVIQRNNAIYPIEVKYGQNVKSKSLTKVLADHPKMIGIRYSSRNLAFDGKILNIPFPLISETFRILQLI